MYVCVSLCLCADGMLAGLIVLDDVQEEDQQFLYNLFSMEGQCVFIITSQTVRAFLRSFVA